MPTPHALLLTAPGCPHCPGVKAALEKLLAEGVISALEVVDISMAPQRAAELGVRSVPWLQLGEFVLTGAQSPQELRRWAEQAAGPASINSYLQHLLEDGQLADAEVFLKQHPQHIAALLSLVTDVALPIHVRIGTSALFESFVGSTALQQLVPQLGELTQHPDPRIRADACHFLGLSQASAARHFLEPCLNDANQEVREIAQDAIDELG